MVQVSVEEIERDLSAYLQRVEAGETLLIVRAGQPVAEVKPVMARGKVLRPLGSYCEKSLGQVAVASSARDLSADPACTASVGELASASR